MSASVPIRRSRRAVLGAALGATAATVATAVHVPQARGAGSDGQAVVIGGTYPNAQSQTQIVNTSAIVGDNAANRGLWVESQVGTAVTAKGWTGVAANAVDKAVLAYVPNDTGVGVIAMQGSSLPHFSPPPAGVIGLTATNGGAGVRGYAVGAGAGNTGVYGKSTSTSVAYGVYGLASAATTSTQGVGVYGHAMSSAGGVGAYGWAESATGTTYGVIGQVQSPTGIGVYGFAPTGGTAVRATSTGGVALQTSGRVVVDKVSGVATIAAGTSSITIKPGIVVSTKAFALLTPKADLGTRRLWYTTSPTAGTVTIRVSSAVTAATQIGWLLLG